MTKKARALTWRSQVSWRSNNLKITVETMNIYPCGLVLDDTLYWSHTPPSFGIWDRLILDTTIAYYSITRFSIYFLYFTPQVKPRPETSHGDTLLNQTAGTSRINSSAWKGGYEKKNGHIFYSSQYGDLPYFFVLFCLNQLGCHSPFFDRSSMAPTACTQSRRHRAALPHA